MTQPTKIEAIHSIAVQAHARGASIDPLTILRIIEATPEGSPEALRDDVATMDALIMDIGHNGGQDSPDFDAWSEANRAAWDRIRALVLPAQPARRAEQEDRVFVTVQFEIPSIIPIPEMTLSADGLKYLPITSASVPEAPTSEPPAANLLDIVARHLYETDSNIIRYWIWDDLTDGGRVPYRAAADEILEVISKASNAAPRCTDAAQLGSQGDVRAASEALNFIDKLEPMLENVMPALGYAVSDRSRAAFATIRAILQPKTGDPA